MRHRISQIEINPEVRFQARDATERVRRSIDGTSPVSFEAMDTKLINSPVFRTREPSKWRTKVGFSLDGFREKLFQKATSPKGEDPYIEGRVVLCEKSLVRKRVPEKEVTTSPFSSVAPGDLWKNQLHMTKSIRSKKSIEASIGFANPLLSQTTYNLPMLSNPSLIDQKGGNDV